MVIGLAVWELHLPGCDSLKAKRSVLKSVKARLHNEYNVSVAETGHRDAHRRAEIAACVVSADQAHANSVLTTLDTFMAAESRFRIVDSYTNYY